jgi:CheY-like chemotaxis protein
MGPEARQTYHKLHKRSAGKRSRSDVTERRLQDLKTQLLHERLALFCRIATFSELIAWLAHELNQPLMAILGNAQAALRMMDRGDPDLKELREIFADIIADDRRAAADIHRIRFMLERRVIELNPLPLNDLIEEIIPLIRNDALAGNVSIDLDLGLSLPAIKADRLQLQQVILNLVVNAFESMHASERPQKLILRTRHADGEVVLDIVDSGIGIPHDELNCIFEPLVTTKLDALGMGLPLSRSIMMKHNGRLWAENNIDGGATFHLALPVENSARPARAVDVERRPHEDAGLRSGGLTVLIADDRETFRRAVASILSDLPELKLVAEAADGAGAIKMAAELNPDLILLDVGLPIIDGVEAAARIRATTPDSKILFLTQHDSPDFVRAAMKAGALGYVLKVDAGRELLQAAMAVARGEQYISSGVRH